MSDLINTQTSNVTDPSSRPAQIDYILLDASGSMHSRRDDSLNAIDNFSDQLRNENINTTLVVATFSSGSFNEMDYQVWRETSPQSYSGLRFDSEFSLAGGSTPLYDAINVMARDLRQRMPQKASILIITDGDENASKTTATEARAMLDWIRAQGWQVTFLGCDFENSHQAKLLGASDANAIGVQAKRLVDATSLLAEKRARYSQYGTDMDMSKEDKEELGGLLPDFSAK